MSAEARQETNIEKAELWERSNMTLAGRAAMQHIPLGGTFELTPRCNLRCKMCYVRLDRPEMDRIGRELTAKEWISLAKEAVDAGTLDLLLTGGEPLLREDFEEIYTTLTHMGFIITLNTNATLLTPRLVKLFQKYPPTATKVTLYGASPETYGIICGNPDAFEDTVRGLEQFSKLPTAVEVRTTFIRDNMAELDAIRTLANRYTKRFAINVAVFKAVRGAVSDVENCRLSPSQVFEVTKANVLYYRQQGEQEEAAAEGSMETDQYAQAKEYGFDLPPKIITCLGAKSVYWITWDGKMLPCGSFSSPYTLPLQEGFVPAWNRLPGLFEKIELPERCRSCEYAEAGCANCPAILQAETGQPDQVSEYICAIAKERGRRRDHPET